jgi:hypothetical protein
MGEFERPLLDRDLGGGSIVIVAVEVSKPLVRNGRPDLGFNPLRCLRSLIRLG